MDPLIADLRRFIIENFLFGDESADFSDDDSFQERAIVDSTGILELVAHLEETYGIDVTDADLIPENLDSLTQVARFVQRKRRERNAEINAG